MKDTTPIKSRFTQCAYPEWLAQLQTDPEFIENLNHEMESAEVRASSHGALFNPNRVWTETVQELWDLELECRHDLARRAS
jgi:hypothetical protein